MTTRTAFADPAAPSAAGLLRPPAEVALMVGGSTIIGLLIAPAWGTSPVDLLYLPAVLAAAVLHGLWPGLFAALASALAYNYFFTAPVHSLRIDRPSDLVTVALLFLVAAVTSQLAARMRRAARTATANAERNASIAGFARRLLSSSSAEDIGAAATRELAALFDCNATLVVAGSPPQAIARAPADAPINLSDLSAAALALETGGTAGRGTNRLDPAEWQFHPVRSDSGTLAALGLARDDGRPPVRDDQRALLDSMVDQIALALARAALETEVRSVATLKERDRLRNALLSSVGHDLRTPLTAIVGAAGELRRTGADAALAGTVAAEATKLERYIGNLLDMARIEAGGVPVRMEPVDLVDAVDAALRDVQPGARTVEVALADDLPLVRADARLLHHILINLLDNAMRHTPADTPLRIEAARSGEGVRLGVCDRGPGLPDEPAALFTAFHRGTGSDGKGGAGLGLAIVHAFAEAMGASVSASDRDGGGAVFSLDFACFVVAEETPVGAGA